jgi:hypothetical protein
MARGVVANNDDIFAQLAVQETPEDPLPESEWLANVGDKVNVTVKVPVHPDWDCLLRRQDSNMEVSLRSTAIKLRKEKKKPLPGLSEYRRKTAKKQKLQWGAAGLMINQMSLAFYNVAQSSIISLEEKKTLWSNERYFATVSAIAPDLWKLCQTARRSLHMFR